MNRSIIQSMIWLCCVAMTAVALGDTPTKGLRVNGCRIKPADQVTLAVNQSGVIDVVPREGDWVEAGQRIIQLEDELACATLEVAKREAENDADIRFAETGSEVARLEHEQAIKVNNSVKGSLTVTDIRRRKLELDQSVLQIEQARFRQSIAILKRNEAAAQLKSYYVIAPFSGTVNKVWKHKGETVRHGDPIVELVNCRRVRVEGYVDAADRRQVASGMPIDVALEIRAEQGVARPMTGKIVFVDSIVQSVTQQVRVWADVENVDDLLSPGLTGVMTISPSAVPLATTNR